MLKKNRTLFLAIAYSIFCTTAISAQEPLTDSTELDQTVEIVEVEEVILPEIQDSISDSFLTIELPETPLWEKATLKGKLKMQGLPVTPNLKIFMIKDSLVTISLSASFFGEVGRLDITPDSVIAINKMQKTYVSESLKGKLVDGKILGVKEIQDFLLARFFLPGINLDEYNLDDVVEIFEVDGQLDVVPKGIAEITGLKYGYVIDEEFNPLMLIVIPEGKNDMEIDAVYNYGLNGYDIKLAWKDGQRLTEMTLELSNPVFSGDAPKAIDISKKYRKVSFQEFLRF